MTFNGAFFNIWWCVLHRCTAHQKNPAIVAENTSFFSQDISIIWLVSLMKNAYNNKVSIAMLYWCFVFLDIANISDGLSIKTLTTGYFHSKMLPFHYICDLKLKGSFCFYCTSSKTTNGNFAHVWQDHFYSISKHSKVFRLLESWFKSSIMLTIL